MLGNNYLLWENDNFVVKTPFNPHISYAEGLHLVITTNHELESAWSNPSLSAEGFKLAARICKIMEENGFAPWFNIQSNGNWGLLSDGQKFFHIHIYGRNKTDNWGKPIVLPELPNTYQNDPMPEEARQKLGELLGELL